MAEATVTIKLNPNEYDLLRGAVRSSIEFAKEANKDERLSAADRSKARARHLQLTTLGQRLNV